MYQVEIIKQNKKIEDMYRTKHHKKDNQLQNNVNATAPTLC